MTTELIESLEARWSALVDERMTALGEALKNKTPGTRGQIIKQFNEDPTYEGQFDELEMKIRVVDPDHEFLPENSSF